MKRLWGKFVFLLFLFFASEIVQADPVSGTIRFAGGATLDTVSLATANQITNWVSSSFSTSVGSGSFTNVPSGTQISFASETWPFTTTSPIINFWNFGGYSFTLVSSSVLARLDEDFLAMKVLGTISGNGLSTTTGILTFSMTDAANGTRGDPTFAFAAVLTAQATPTLFLAATNNNLLISWQTNNPLNFVLQESDQPAGSQWIVVTNVPQITNSRSYVTLPILTASNRYFRLISE